MAALRSTSGIRDVSLMLFDRTFEITGVLRTLAGIVAFFGVLSAVLALQLERLHELAVLRSLGMSLAQLRTNLVVQTGLLGLAAAGAAIPIGALLAWLLVFVINRRAFGWSMEFELAAAPIGNGIVLALVAATLSGVSAAFAGRMRRGTIESVSL
jgi:putative ABC transport system permease protein